MDLQNHYIDLAFSRLSLINWRSCKLPANEANRNSWVAALIFPMKSLYCTCMTKEQEKHVNMTMTLLRPDLKGTWSWLLHIVAKHKYFGNTWDADKLTVICQHLLKDSVSPVQTEERGWHCERKCQHFCTQIFHLVWQQCGENVVFLVFIHISRGIRRKK